MANTFRDILTQEIAAVQAVLKIVAPGDPKIDGPTHQSVDVRELNAIYGSFLANKGDNLRIVVTTGNALDNGDALQAAYLEAKAHNPNGQAKSALNRVVIGLPDGRYDLGIQPLALDTPYIDIVGLSGDRNAVVVTSNVSSASAGTIIQATDNIVLKSFTIHTTAATVISGDNTDPYAFGVQTSYPNSRYVDMKMSAIAGSIPMRLGMPYAGMWEGCDLGDYAMSGGGGGISAYSITATLVSCKGGFGAFCGDPDLGMSIMSSFDGLAMNCIGGTGAFGNVGAGTYIGCIAIHDNAEQSPLTGQPPLTGPFAWTRDSNLPFNGLIQGCSVIGNAQAFTGIPQGGDSGIVSSGRIQDCSASYGFTGIRSPAPVWPGKCNVVINNCKGLSGPSFLVVTDAGVSFQDPGFVFEGCHGGVGSLFSTGSPGVRSTGTYINCTTVGPVIQTAPFTGRLHNCFIDFGSTDSVLTVGDGAKIGHTTIRTGSAASIYAPTPVSASIFNCSLSTVIDGNVTNQVATPYNVVDPDI